MTYGSIAAKIGDASCQKAFLLYVRPQESKWLIAGREWDRTVQRLGPLLTATTTRRRAIADASLELLERLFSPLLIINDADRESKTVTATVHAGSIPLGRSARGAAEKRFAFPDVFSLSRFERQRSQCAAGSVDVPGARRVKDGRAKCTVASTYRAPLAANMRRRVEAVAILLRPSLPETRLKLVVGRANSRPLAGMFVDMRTARSRQAAKSGRAKQRHELLSDRQGEVTIGAEPGIRCDCCKFIAVRCFWPAGRSWRESIRKSPSSLPTTRSA